MYSESCAYKVIATELLLFCSVYKAFYLLGWWCAVLTQYCGVPQACLPYLSLMCTVCGSNN